MIDPPPLPERKHILDRLLSLQRADCWRYCLTCYRWKRVGGTEWAQNNPHSCKL